MYSNRAFSHSTRQRALGQLGLGAGVAAAVYICGYAAASPNDRLLTLLYLLIAVSIAIALRPDFLVPASLLVFAVSTSIAEPVLHSLPVSVYVTDVVVGLLVLRATLPRERQAPSAALAGLPKLLFVLWAIVMAIAAVRGMNAGVDFESTIRGEVSLVYLPLLYFAFSRLLRERELTTSLLWRNLAFVAVGLAAWMFLARALNHPFADPGLGRVPTGAGDAIYRNFGFAAAFIVYPALALVGIAGMAHGGSNRLRWTMLAMVGILATLMTFVRGEIFALALGSLVILWLRPRNPGLSARARTAAQLSFAVVAAVLGLIALNPSLGHAVVQRALVFAGQAEEAELNVQYREDAVATGVDFARAHPAGLGVLDIGRLDALEIDPGYLAHSGVATLLLFGGWPALATALIVVFALLWRSARTPTPVPWLHPAFVGVLVMLTVYSVGAAGLAGDTWVIALGALVVALRFDLPVRDTIPVSDAPPEPSIRGLTPATARPRQ
jgi:hypothetical protein